MAANSNPNIPAKTIPVTDENNIPAPDNSSASPAQTNFGTTGVEASVTEVLDTDRQTIAALRRYYGNNPDTSNQTFIRGVDANGRDMATALRPLVVSGDTSLDKEKPQGEIKEASDNSAIQILPTKNVLHDYASFAYRITLGAQDVTDYNRMVDNGDTPNATGLPTMTTTLMTSGGADKIDQPSSPGGWVSRNELFKEDFYIENLKVMTIIGPNKNTVGTNAINIEFEIVEPYSVSLIDRLIDLAKELGVKNYIEIPYLLRIDFVGYDSDNNPISGAVNTKTTKYIPIKIAHIKFKVSEKGAAYAISAIPYNHFAFSQTIATVPVNVTVPASNVASFFNKKGNLNSAGSLNPDNSARSQSDGLVDIVNEYNRKLTEAPATEKKKACRLVADQIHIEFAPDKESQKIATSKIELEELSKVVKTTTYKNVDSRDSKRGKDAQERVVVGTYDHHYNRGTSIPAIIEGVIKNSAYYKDQVRKFEEEKRQQQQDAKAAEVRGGGFYSPPAPLKEPAFKSYKVTSSYKIGEYDEYANRHAYDVTFYIQAYTVEGQSSGLTGKVKPEWISKEYNYLFTGDNQDIIDLDIDFNLLWFNARSVNTKQTGQATGQKRKEKITQQGNNADTTTDRLAQLPTECIEIDMQGQAGHAGTFSDDKAIQIADAQNSLLTDSRGDMISINMTILGDPQFIKQDDIIHKSFADKGQPIGPTGSIITDKGQIYIRLRFDTKSDIDHDTGLRYDYRDMGANPRPGSQRARTGSTAGRKSDFDGIYRVLTVDNNFDRGMFTQQLQVVRVYVQD